MNLPRWSFRTLGGETTAIYTEGSIRQLQEVHARCHPRRPGQWSVPEAASAQPMIEL